MKDPLFVPGVDWLMLWECVWEKVSECEREREIQMFMYMNRFEIHKQFTKLKQERLEFTHIYCSIRMCLCSPLTIRLCFLHLISCAKVWIKTLSRCKTQRAAGGTSPWAHNVNYCQTCQTCIRCAHFWPPHYAAFSNYTPVCPHWSWSGVHVRTDHRTHSTTNTTDTDAHW